MQAPHVTFLATFDLSTGSPRSKTTKRNGICEYLREKPKTSEREQNPASNFSQLTVVPHTKNNCSAWELLHVVGEEKAEGESREEHGI